MKRPGAAVDADLLVAYHQMLQDETREAEARDWIEGLIEDAASASPGPAAPRHGNSKICPTLRGPADRSSE